MENKQDFGIGVLIKRVTAEYQRLESEALAQEKAERKKIEELCQKEKRLEGELAGAREIAKKMMDEYSELEAKIETDKRRQIEESAIKEKDVKAGHVSLRDFFSRGKREEQITKETIEATQRDLESILKTVREKNLEVLNLERDLYQTQIDIRFLAIYPSRIMSEKLKALRQFLDQQTSFFLEYMPQCQSALEQANHQILLTQGKSLSPGFSWEARTVKEARKIIFSPIIPLELVQELKEKLASMEEDKMVTVNYYLGRAGQPGTIDVDYSLMRDKEKNKPKFSTHEIDIRRENHG